MRRRSTTRQLREEVTTRSSQTTFYVQLPVPLKDQWQHRRVQQVRMHGWIESEPMGEDSVHQVGMGFRTDLSVHEPLLIEGGGFGLRALGQQLEEVSAAEGIETGDPGVIDIRAVGIDANSQPAQNDGRAEIERKDGIGVRQIAHIADVANKP